jgi:hypothetical protein
MSKAPRKPPKCPYCDQPAVLVGGDHIYPRRPDLAHKRFWRCDPCDAHVGCHQTGGGTVPLGRLANAALRKAKMAAHAAFDPVWRDGRLSRREAYRRLAAALEIPVAKCHIGYFDVDRCEATVAAAPTLLLEDPRWTPS